MVFELVVKQVETTSYSRATSKQRMSSVAYRRRLVYCPILDIHLNPERVKGVMTKRDSTELSLWAPGSVASV